jgi:hypothetical protein
MMSKKTFRNRKARAASRSALRVECLESRLALAVLGGNVNAQLVGSTLLLTGDALDNALVVSTATGGRMAVLGGFGTTINGSTSPFVTNRAVTSIVANLNAGNDVIGFTNSAVGLGNQLTAFGIFSPFAPTLQADIDTATGGIPTFTLPGSLTVTTAAGNDAVGIIGTVGGSVAASLGSSSSLAGPGQGNGFAIGDPAVASVANRVGGSVSVVGGAQRDVVRFSGTDVGGAISATLGNGENYATVNGAGAAFGSFVYAGGTGNDFVGLGNQVTIRHGVSVLTGARGEDAVGIYGNVNVGGSVALNTGTAADDDSIELGAAIRGGLSVITGAGNDQISVSESTIGLNTVIDAGAGNDRVFSSELTTRSNLFVYLGPGNDELDLSNVRAAAAFLYGGTGTNTLTTNAATRAGIRFLKYFQFQAVNEL